ncbi:MAG: metallophosphoesterase [Myxococcota bacterium]|nr:metallophosphoesterase [Myxococcota bacterium]
MAGEHSAILSGRVPHRVRIGSESQRLPRRMIDPCASLKFAILGDGRAAVDGVGPSAYWTAFNQEVQRHQPKFILNTGDLVKNGLNEREWHHFIHQTQAWPPMVMVRGNHDRGGIFERLKMNPGRVFWFTSGVMGVVGFDTEVGLGGELLLGARLEMALQRLDTPWKIVFLHRPIYSRSRHGSDERGWNQWLIPIFDRHDVTLVVSGHDHNYERFCRQRGRGVERRCSPHRGTVYLVSGGAATFTAPFPGLAPNRSPLESDMDKATSRVFSNAHHFVTVDASPNTLTLTAIRTRVGNVRPAGQFDTLTLTRTSKRCPP